VRTRRGARTVRDELYIDDARVPSAVLSILPYDTEDEPIDIANDSTYGLAGAVWAETKSVQL
jgi:aldehyde dehydrogenase (NAD+)